MAACKGGAKPKSRAKSTQATNATTRATPKLASSHTGVWELANVSG
jgi:hypothetical protein